MFHTGAAMRYRVCPESLMTVCTSVLVMVGTTSGLVEWLTTLVESSLQDATASRTVSVMTMCSRCLNA